MATEKKPFMSVVGSADAVARGEKLIADADEMAVRTYGCHQWTCRDAHRDEMIAPERESFIEILLGAAAIAQASPATVEVGGVHPETGAFVPIITLQQPSIAVERWLLEKLGCDERDAAAVGASVVQGAIELQMHRMGLAAALTAPGNGTEH